MDKEQLFSQLKSAREDHDIYLIARTAMLLQGRGCTNMLTDEEKASVLQCLQNARMREGLLGLEPGYELARWILICQYLLPERDARPTANDIDMIQEACDAYCKDRILKQVASLVHMARVLGIRLNINTLPPKKRKLVAKLAATLA